MLDDLKFALRRLRHSPGFVAVAVLTLAVADAELFRPLPFKDPDRVFLMQILNQKTGTRSTRFDNAFIDAINDRHALVRLMVGQAIVPVLVGLAAGLLSAKYAARRAARVDPTIVLRSE